MSNLIPPLLSSSPPPIVGPLDEEDDDEFGDFRAATDSYDCDDFSLPPSPQKSPEKETKVDFPKIALDINSNNNSKVKGTSDVAGQNSEELIVSEGVNKDFQDRRKVEENEQIDSLKSSETHVNSSNSPFTSFDTHSVESIPVVTSIDKVEDTDTSFINNEIVEKPCTVSVETTEEFVENCASQENANLNLNSEINEFTGCEIKEDIPKRDSLDLQNITPSSASGNCYENKENSSTEVKFAQSSHDYSESIVQNLSEVGSESPAPLELDTTVEIVKQSLDESVDNNEDKNREFQGTVVPIEEAKFSESGDDFGDFENHFANSVAQEEQKEFKFNAFDEHVKSESPSLVKYDFDNVQEKPAKDDDFGDFESSHSPNEDLQDATVCKNETELDESGDDFGDFENHFADNVAQEQSEQSKFDDFDVFMRSDASPAENCDFENYQKNSTEEDDDFGDFESSGLPKTEADDDEFGDFSTQSISETPVVLNVDYKDVFSKTEKIVKDVFLSQGEDIEDYQYVDDTSNNAVFNALKDVTETTALTYQWSKSNGQKLLLKSLNIDMRNILYGPAWNCSMPRFAANLSLAPLEPVKSEILTPTPVQNVTSPSNSSQKSQLNGDIPAAQFDWSGSGLVNPLDYLEQLVASLDIPTTTNPTSGSNQSPSPSNELLDDWDIWLQSTSVAETPGNTAEDSSRLPDKTDLFLPNVSEKIASLDSEVVQSKEHTDSDSSHNLDLPTNSASEQPDDKKPDIASGFSPFQSPKMIPLRETYISSENNPQITLDKPNWFQATILTPEMPRKDTVVDQDDDDFDDFQMVLPEKSKETDDKPQSNNGLKPNIDLSEFEAAEAVFPVDSKSPHVHEQNFETSKTSPVLNHSLDFPKQSQPNKSDNVEDDDEFTDFHSSLPPVEVAKPLQPVPLEPLKPSIQYATPLSTQINWPDPGVTDEDIRNIELAYSRNKIENSDLMVEEKNNFSLDKNLGVKSPVSKNPPKEKEVSVDEDEWSDFVSVQHPAARSIAPERTSTPDLPLSVLNLNQVQPAKQPIPVITPSGLVQTKLSANMTGQPKASNVVQTTMQPNNLFKPQPAQFQPCIISNQFAGNMFQSQPNNFGGASAGFSAPFNAIKPIVPIQVAPNYQQRGATSQVKSAPIDEDDWSDFVSSQPAPQVANGFQQKLPFVQGKAPPQPANWTPNIITNPSHFDSFQSYVPQHSKRGSAVNVQSKSAIPSISAMPDLDFIAPKNRTSKK